MSDRIRNLWRPLLVAAFVVAAAVPAAAQTSSFDGWFRDDEGSVHERNVDWMADRGLTYGCNPPADGGVGDRYCPDEALTRGQQASFFRRYTDHLDTRPAAQVLSAPVGVMPQPGSKGFLTVEPGIRRSGRWSWSPVLRQGAEWAPGTALAFYEVRFEVVEGSGSQLLAQAWVQSADEECDPIQSTHGDRNLSDDRRYETVTGFDALEVAAAAPSWALCWDLLYGTSIGEPVTVAVEPLEWVVSYHPFPSFSG